MSSLDDFVCFPSFKGIDLFSTELLLAGCVHRTLLALGCHVGMGDEKAEENLKKIKLPKTCAGKKIFLRMQKLLVFFLFLFSNELVFLQICDEQWLQAGPPRPQPRQTDTKPESACGKIG